MRLETQTFLTGLSVNLCTCKVHTCMRTRSALYRRRDVTERNALLAKMEGCGFSEEALLLLSEPFPAGLLKGYVRIHSAGPSSKIPAVSARISFFQ